MQYLCVISTFMNSLIHLDCADLLQMVMSIEDFYQD